MNAYAWVPCVDCGMVRFVSMRKGAPTSKRCRPCGVKHRNKTAAGGILWPTSKLADPPSLTPREAWSALLAREITPDVFGAVLRVWEGVGGRGEEATRPAGTPPTPGKP